MDHLDETTIGLFLEHRLPDEQVRGMVHHIDECDACRQLVAELGRGSVRIAEGSTLAAAGLPPAPYAARRTRTRGERIGRYVVIDLVGAGAMGAVYAAFDPDLDRKIAVKLLHTGAAATDDERTRMMREAQALARVSHAGVVAVHDVGTHDDQVFIAMEFVAGGTLKAWLAERPRSWRDILEIGIAAGRGLEAAHAVGLVHRDVKPDNILVDQRGVARIGDFGLAAGVGTPPKRPSDPAVAGSASSFAADLTASGAIVGTLAYMAPEQLEGAPATTRSDQFSFCATLYEALYGIRSYPGANLDQIARAMKIQRIAEPANDRGIPTRVRAAIVRGLSIDPAARHASMAELLGALEANPWSRRRLALLGLAGAAVVGGVAFGVTTTRETAATPCTTAESELASVWNPARRAAVQGAILATKLPFAADSWSRVERALDAYARGWTAMHTQTCEATAVHRSQSPALLDRRMSCLDHRRLDLDAAIAALAASDRETVRHAIEVTSRLPALAACSDPTRLSAVLPPPADPASTIEIAAIQREIARVRALDHAASPVQAVDAGARVVARAERVGYPPVLAAAYFALGSAQVSLARPLETRDSFEKAIAAATRGGDEEIAARSLANLAMVLRHDSPDGKVATGHVLQALAIVEKTRRDPLLEAEIRYASIEVLAGIDQKAVAVHLERGRERLAAAAAAGADTRLLQLEFEKIDAFLDIVPDFALAKITKALRTAEELYGASHPQVAAVLVHMAHYALLANRPDEARAHATRVAEILAPYPGNEIELRRIEAMLETDPKKRRPILDEVVKLAVTLYGPRSPQVASDREAFAEVLLELEMYREGLAQIDATIEIWEATYGGHYEKMITSLVTRAQLLAGLEDWDGVAAAAERANAIVDHGGMREITKSMAKLLLVDVYFRQKRFAESLETLEGIMPALKMVMLGDPAGTILDFYLAACKWELDRDRPAVLRIARAAYKTYRSVPQPDKASIAFMTEWLAGK